MLPEAKYVILGVIYLEKKDLKKRISEGKSLNSILIRSIA
jgi:hypothetical protein